MEHNILAANCVKLDNLADYLEEQILSISVSFDEMDRLISNLSQSFKDNNYFELDKKYIQLSNNYNIIKTNLETYKKDFITIKNNHIGFVKNYQTSKIDEINIEGGDYTGVSD